MSYTIKTKEKFIRKPHKHVCDNCGSDNISQTYTCYWDVIKQVWISEDVTDEEAWCNECQCECSIAYINLTQEEANERRRKISLSRV